MFRATPEISNTDLQQARIVHFVESGKHAKPACICSMPQSSASISKFALSNFQTRAMRDELKNIHSKNCILFFFFAFQNIL